MLYFVSSGIWVWFYYICFERQGNRLLKFGVEHRKFSQKVKCISHSAIPNFQPPIILYKSRGRDFFPFFRFSTHSKNPTWYDRCFWVSSLLQEFNGIELWYYDDVFQQVNGNNVMKAHLKTSFGPFLSLSISRRQKRYSQAYVVCYTLYLKCWLFVRYSMTSMVMASSLSVFAILVLLKKPFYRFGWYQQKLTYN
jgi:hypothetical protein